jgi:outer membrane protein insertion porin family
LFSFKRRVNPQTTFKLSFEYQLRLNYYQTHVLAASLFAFSWDPVKNQHITIAPFEWNLVNANLSPQFAETLKGYNLYFQNIFKNQVITDIHGSWSVTNQNPTSVTQKHFYFLKINGEVSGLVFDALRNELPDTGSGHYINGLAPYSQYIKGDIEYRRYWILDKKQKIATRFIFGAGLPYYNSSELPYIKSFWAGGSNDIRAWQVQTLGPGGSPSSGVAGQVGDIKLEYNWEYRVNLIKYFSFAWFVDAGNIWLVKNQANNSVPLAYMSIEKPNPFWNEIAVGTGPGLRLDFTYFVVRVDFGQPLHDPALPQGSRWIPLHDYSTRRTVVNFGIGYPF